MKSKIFATILAATLLLTLTACKKAKLPDNGASSATSIEQVEPPEKSEVPDGKDNLEDENTTENEPWKAEFEKSLLENYGVTLDYYEDLGNGVYQVYVEIDGKIIPYVTVDSATGDYHG